MAFETGTHELVCPHCSARHAARWSRMPVKEEVKLRCQACQAVLLERRSVFDYDEVTLIERPSPT